MNITDREYREQIQERLQTLTGRAGEIARKFYQYKTEGYRSRWTRYHELKNLLLEGQFKTTAAIFQNGPYQLIEEIAGRSIAERALKIAARLQLYVYSRDSYRRSFRTTDATAYDERLISLLEFVYLPGGEFDLVKHLTMRADEDSQSIAVDQFVVADMIAIEIDEGNSTVINLINDICLGDNNTKLLDDCIITGVFRSADTQLHKLMCDLLLAAKLQEGLRQSILEAADMGRMEAFVMVLNTIIEHQLVRYSSVVRALDVWMGLGEAADDSRRRVTEKLANLAYLYLTDESARQAAEISSDVLELYVALWAASAYEISAIGPLIDKLMHGAQYQKLVAMYFVSNTQFPQFKSKIAVQYIKETNLDVLAYVLDNVDISVGFYGNKQNFLEQVKANHILADADFRNTLFSRLIEILPAIPQGGYTVAGKPFDWGCVQISRAAIFRMLFGIAGWENTGERNGVLLVNMMYADSDSRCAFLKFFADTANTQTEREFLFASLADKSMPVRTQALANIKPLELCDHEDAQIIKLLTLKTGDIRQGAVNILLALPAQRLHDALENLLADKNENKRLAGLDMLLRRVKEQQLTREAALAYTALMPKTSEREKILLDELAIPKSQYSSENGFGLYDPDYMNKLDLHLPTTRYQMKHLFGFSLARIKALVDSFVALMAANKDYSFTAEVYSGHCEDCVLGTMQYMRYPASAARKKAERTIDDFVLPDVWRGWLCDNKVTFAELVVLLFADEVASYDDTYTPEYAPWANQLIAAWFNVTDVAALIRYYRKIDYARLMPDIMKLLSWEFPEAERYDLLAGVYIDLMNGITASEWRRSLEAEQDCYHQQDTLLMEADELDFLLTWLKKACQADAHFTGYVAICYALGRLADMTYYGLEETDVARAYELKLIPRDALSKMMFKASYNRGYIRDYAGKPRYAGARKIVERYPILLETATQAAARIIEIEVKRGDTPTEVSKLAGSIGYHEGIDSFVNILIALGSETFVRGYSYSSDNTKKHVLSSLLKTCHPAKSDNAETLKHALAGRIDDKRLLEAAMYSPAWLTIVADYLGWKGLASAAWYFHAHINESFSADKETAVAHYSPITPQQFNDGAFDVAWFKDAYKLLGKQHFAVLYDCAKYLTDGANHRRAQLFADASLGKLKLAELQKEIKDKRNKDKLLAYSLIPLKRDAHKDMLNRYEFIQAFLAESKQFGAQRRESEGKVCAISLDNLARTAGFADSLRLSWRMETLKIEQISACFIPRDCQGVTICIEIDPQGTAALVCEKDGKRLASVPAKIKKDPYIAQCREVVSSLKNQQKRARIALENAMIRCDVFTYGELSDLMKHPVISPLVAKLLFAHGNRVDTYAAFGGIGNDAVLKIAHAHDLYQSGTWLEWQRFAFANQLMQPFKQVFRELYMPNQDELHEGVVSRRYAGHQIQAGKTVALLKTRGWTVDHEDGLQKVYYQENIIAAMYAAADWFSPADTEAPTLETVQFFDRKTYKALVLADIPPVIFSEVMRDIDLVVSVAHIGGVDPEASHSTIEMRAAIVGELLGLLKVDNVTVKDRHAFVDGMLGQYTVHLGSGVCHMMGRGAIQILAVPSQHRGRIFLPFADEDPRTAEIMAKILLLADDKSIKDPAILGQMG